MCLNLKMVALCRKKLGHIMTRTVSGILYWVPLYYFSLLKLIDNYLHLRIIYKFLDEVIGQY